MSLQVHVPEDHGAVDIINVGPHRVELAPHDYPEDTYPNIWYWFCVRNAGSAAAAPARIVLSGLIAGPEPERVYVPFWSMSIWSRDGEHWERVPPSCQAIGDERVEFTTDLAPGESVWIAETFPMPWEHCLGFMQGMPEIKEAGFELERMHLGESELGRPILAARISDGKPRPALVLIGGQHAVEESGKLFCETVLEWLVKRRESAAVRGILSQYEIFVAPEVNPDGCCDGRMNTNARGVIMNSPDDDSAEMRAQLRLVDRARLHILVDCHGWGNTIGRPPYDGWYRRKGEDPLFDHIAARVPGAATSTEHLLDGVFRLEPYVREKFRAHAGMLEINWNFCVRPDGSVVQPTIEDLRARSIEYFRAIAAFEG
jgi:hypothetical protein